MNIFKENILLYNARGADKSFARPTSRCRRTESIVSLEGGVCSCAQLQAFSCYRGRKEACQATRTISTMDETWLYHYNPETKQQSMEWRYSGSLRPKKFRVQKSAGKFFASIFFGIKTTSSTLIIFERAKLSMRSITHLCWCNWRTFWKKKAGRGKVTKGALFLHDNAPAHRTFATQTKLPAWASSVVVTHPILRIWPHWAITCSLDWKYNWKFAKSLLPRKPGWTDKILHFLSILQTLEQLAKKCIELRGEYVE